MPTAAEQLIVRRHAPRRAALAWVGSVLVVLAALTLAFEGGRLRAGYSVVDALADHHRLSEEVRTLTAALNDARARLSAAELARRIDKESYRQVEKSLADLEARLGEQSQELTFYRGIVNPADGIAGLRIERVKVLPGAAPHRYRVRIVLIQGGTQDAVTSASAELTVDGTRAGRAVRLPLAELGPEARPLAFSFRYFQELDTEIQLPADVVPQHLQVEVRPAKASAPIRQTYAWKIDPN